MAYAPHNFFGDGVQADFIYTFDVLGGFSNVIVKTQVVGGNLTQLTRGVEYEEISPKTIRFNTGFIPAGVSGGDGTNSTLVNITRLTSRSRLIDYIGGGTIRERDLDNDYNRLTSVDEEIEAGVFAALFKNDAGIAWNGESLPSENCGPAIVVTGWATLGQVQDLVSDLNVADLSTPIILVFTGDGVETEFELAGVRGGIAGQADVYINSVYQSSDQAAGLYTLLSEGDTDYPSAGGVGGNDFIAFTDPPPLGAEIEIKQFTGVVLGVLPAEFVNLANQIANNLIDLQHLGIDAGFSERFIVFDDTGDIPVARRIGIEDLKATSQTLGADVRNALNNATSGLRLNDFLRDNAGNVDFKSFLLKGVGSPVDSGDAANKAYVDGNSVQIARGEVTSGLPQGLGATLDITVGFQPDFFICHVNFPNMGTGRLGPWSAAHTFIRGGPSTQESVFSQPRVFGPTGGTVTGSMFRIKIQTTTKVRIENNTRDNFQVQLTNITSVTWFAVKLGI